MCTIKSRLHCHHTKDKNLTKKKAKNVYVVDNPCKCPIIIYISIRIRRISGRPPIMDWGAILVCICSLVRSTLSDPLVRSIIHNIVRSTHTDKTPRCSGFKVYLEKGNKLYKYKINDDKYCYWWAWIVVIYGVPTRKTRPLSISQIQLGLEQHIAVLCFSVTWIWK